MNTVRKTLAWVGLFAIAMGYLESSVVVYLRELYYPAGFKFPLTSIPPFIARVEFFREAATVIMLVGIGIIAGKTRLQRFAYFVLAFAIWDLFYYVFLYVCLGWPQSLFTWDILFLIPVPWVGPVWAPCLLSLLMMAGAVFIILKTEKGNSFAVSRGQWWLMISGAITCIVSFMWDYLRTIINPDCMWSLFSSDSLFSELQSYIPASFNAALFFTGFTLMCASIIINNLNQVKNENK